MCAMGLVCCVCVFVHIGTIWALPHSNKSGILEGSPRSTGIIPAVINNVVPEDIEEGDICSITCPRTWINDTWCDSGCFNEICQLDIQDCEGWCSPDCKPAWLGDGYCDIDCYRSECNFDDGDCDNQLPEGFSLSSSSSEFDFSNCTCDASLLGDGKCNDECNSLECNFDAGDCQHMCSSTCPFSWLGDGDCDYGCNSPSCFHDKGDCKQCQPGCELGMIGNGVCDEQCNVEDCSFDMGDCNNVCWSSKKIDYISEPFTYPHCRSDWVGDGFCDCYCNVPECQNDMMECDNANCTAEYKYLIDLYTRFNLTSKIPESFKV